MVTPSYILAWAYSLADVHDKGMKTYKADGDTITRTCIINMADCFIWQTLASVAIPGFVINRTVSVAQYFLHSFRNYSYSHAFFGGRLPIKFVPVFVGLSTIPFIVHPIDDATTTIMEYSFRRVFPLPSTESPPNL